MGTLHRIGQSSKSGDTNHSQDDILIIGGGDGSGGNDMIERVKKLEEQMLSLLTDVAVIKSNYVTKADLHEEISKQTKWIAATIIGTTAAALAVARLLF